MNERPSQQHPTEPVRFRTPPGWPAPTATWVDRHRLAEPAPGWVPAPGLPAAPQGWRFWDVDRRVLAAGTSRTLVRIGLGLLVAGVVAAVVVLSVGGPVRGLTVFALVPIAVGAALAVTAVARRVADEDAELARLVVQASGDRAGAPVDPADAWGTAEALPFVESPTVRTVSPLRRRHRTAVLVVTGAAAVATIVGASLAVVPVVGAVGGGQTLAVGLQDDDGSPAPTAPDDDGSPAPTAPDTDPTSPAVPSTIPVDAQLEQGTALQADCEVAQGRGGPAHCWAWALTAPAACEARVTAHFGATADGPSSRTETRFVALTPGVTLSLVLAGDETIAGLDHPECVPSGRSPYPITTYDSGADLPDSDFPAACDDWGCDGFVFVAESACPAATIQMAIDDVAADQHTRDYVVVQAITDSTSTTPNEVFLPYAHGTQPADASITSVTCEG
ncbi:hypothetical protein ASG04_09380 [Curtobacterium sp. Leaf183]|uniref:hypothetical protein n=1 Tax=Curtobacterium sp. Leaf183 TaxID=1736291 RepID=UPI0007010625|nr:hypothetical protein [Curtobacterium sp. Leaf183]KQS09090.1 hypothetical protein ASG04_09380 [Curtobacterium sp. Leaf183]